MVERKARGKAAKAKSRGKAAKKGKRKSAGRPEIKVTASDREKVEILIGGGMAVEEIAAAVDMAVNSLKKHFGAELKRGRSRKQAAMLEAMFKAGVGGNVSAQKAYMQHSLLAAADDKVQGAAEPAPAPRAPRAYQGKKDAAQEEAMTAGAGTEWGSDLDPLAPQPGVKPN
ncbi:hypothetical protein [Bradyrhizobium liaoningense]|uniref:hypothetical protein n=1 Tax=Bradyrhizobium liaoningense TaxID=43992 RepID=UPI001BA80768|nr:hypothetical protein [Bradyrhizobium liaoningense]MBR1004746.1 hypothetical protein [Bradyrhizobium liaoningense]